METVTIETSQLCYTYSIIDEDGDVTPEVTADNGSSSLSLGSLDIKR